MDDAQVWLPPEQRVDDDRAVAALVVVFDTEQAGDGLVERGGELEESGERAVVEVPAVRAPSGGDVATLVELTVGLRVAQGTGMLVRDPRVADGGGKGTLREPAAAG